MENKQKTLENFEWFFNMYEKTSERYIESEKFLMELHKMNFFQRLFYSKRKILKFINSRSKYDF